MHAPSFSRISGLSGRDKEKIMRKKSDGALAGKHRRDIRNQKKCMGNDFHPEEQDDLLPFPARDQWSLPQSRHINRFARRRSKLFPPQKGQATATQFLTNQRVAIAISTAPTSIMTSGCILCLSSQPQIRLTNPQNKLLAMSGAKKLRTKCCGDVMSSNVHGFMELRKPSRIASSGAGP
jgi:hypothetical protein